MTRTTSVRCGVIFLVLLVCALPVFAAKTASTTVLKINTVDAATAVVGQTVTLQATVTGATPTGLVTFTDDDGTVLGAVALDGGGVAQMTTPLLSVRLHTITASYPGDVNNDPSPDDTATVDVAKRDATVAVTVDAPTKSIKFGEVANVSATVTSDVSAGPAGTAGAIPATASLASAYNSAAAVRLPSGKVLITGGMKGATDPLAVSTDVYVYDPAGGATSNGIKVGAYTQNAGAGETLNSARAGHTMTVAQDGTVIIIGGSDASAGAVPDPANALDTAEVYNPADQTIVANPGGGIMGTARMYHTATLLPNGKILIIGGEDNSGKLKTVELYDPSTHAFSQPAGLADLNVARSGHTATIYSTDLATTTVKIFVSGGDGATYEVYTVNYATNTGTAAAAIAWSGARDHATASLLPDGRILIAGGEVGGTLQTSVIAFTPASNLATTTPIVTTLAATLSKAYLAGVLLDDATVQLFGGLTNAADATTNLATTSRYITGFDPTGSVTLGSDEAADTVGLCPLGAGTGSGAATCTSTVKAGAVGTTGTHTVSGVYGGDGSHKVGPNAGDTTDTFTVAAAKPVFSGLSNQTTTYGSTSVNLSGVLSFTGNAGAVYPPAGETVTATINGVPGNGTIGANGAFTINFDPSSIPYSATAYTVTYSYTPPVTDTDFVAADNDTSTTLTVNKGVVTASVTANNKVYDGTTDATIASCSLTGVKAGETVTCAASAVATDTSFATKTVGNGKTVTANNITLGGADAGNYDLSTTTATTTANITVRDLTPVAHGVDKPYDGLTDAEVTFTDDRVAGDVFSYTYIATFQKKNPGTWTVTVTNIAISLGDAANYHLTTTTLTTTATITTSGTTLTANVTAANKVYDGTNLATITACTLTGVKPGDTVTCSASTTPTDNTFDTKNIGTGKTVTALNITLGGPDAGTYTLSSTTDTTTANITAKPLTATVTASDKIYDGNTLATITSCTPNGVITGETVTCAASAVATDNTFANKNVGTGKTVTATNITKGGADAGNYTLNPTATTTASITQRTLSATPTGVNKVYDSTTNASVTYADDRVAGDNFTYNVTAAFDTKNVGTAKPITISAVTISTGDAANYSLVPTANTTAADVTLRSLTPVSHGVNKVYDTTPTATVTFTDDRVAGDTFTYAYTASFLDKLVATGKTVNVSGIAISGGDSANYSLTTTTGTTTANITAAPVTASVTASDKIYDGNTTATITSCSVAALPGDNLTCTAAAGAFDTKIVGAPKPVTATGIVLGGTDAGNYSLTSTSAGTTANVTVRTLTATPHGVNRTYDATTDASVTYTADRVAGDVFTYAVTASFNDKNVGTAKPVTISAVSISTGDAPNYTLTTTANTTTADITKANLTPVATGIDKTYDGTNAAAVTIADNRFGTDAITYSYTSTFADKNAGVKAVTVSGIAISGTDAGNYNLTTTSVGTTATINKAHLTVTANNQFKVFDTAMFPGPYSAVLSGFVAGETDAALRTASELSGQASFTGPATTATAVGTYAITPQTGSLTALNYDFTVFVDGTLTIDKAHVKSLKFTAATAIGANVQVTAAVSSGFPANLLAGAKADFLLDGTVFASGVDISSGTASATASGVTSGTHSLKVNFLGNQSFFADSQTLQVNSTSAIPGEVKTLNISVANNVFYGFDPGPITYACVMLEPSITCTVTADSTTLPANFTVKIQTTPSTHAQLNTQPRGMGWIMAAWFGMPGMVFVGLLGPTSRGRKLNWSRTLTILAFISIMLLLFFSVGCGGGSFNNTGNIQPPGQGGTPAGTYMAQVTGTQGGNTQVLAVVPVNVTF